MRKLCIAPESIRAKTAKSLNFTGKNATRAVVCSPTKPKLPILGVGVAIGTELSALLLPKYSKLLLHCSAVLGTTCLYVGRSVAKVVSTCIVEPKGLGSSAS